MENVRCHTSALSCGARCGKPLPGCSHLCRSICHGGACAVPCSQPCGKERATCQHTCATACHSGDCPDTHCGARVAAVCECGLRTEESLCGAWSGNQWPEPKAVNCDAECAAAQRQSRLRLAFKLGVSASEGHKYSASLVALGQKWDKYLRIIEPIYRDVVNRRVGTATHLPIACASRRFLA